MAQGTALLDVLNSWIGVVLGVFGIAGGVFAVWAKLQKPHTERQQELERKHADNAAAIEKVDDKVDTLKTDVRETFYDMRDKSGKILGEAVKAQGAAENVEKEIDRVDEKLEKTKDQIAEVDRRVTRVETRQERDGGDRK